MKYPGIAKEISLEMVEEWMRPRNSEKRFHHTKGVAKVARKIAEKAGVDPFLAELAGWLHDACKEYKAERLVEMAREYGLPLDEILEKHGHLLHGPVGAQVARQELGITNQDVLDAIAEHTLGRVPMSQLSKVVFLADCLEESRPNDYTDPIWKALDWNGKIVNLDAAIAVACDEGIKLLIEDGKPIHPQTVQVRNFYLKSRS
jgi:predicted HD superfamily hydrolase involved in NAD metabolism